MNKRVCRSSTTKLDLICRGLSLTTFVFVIDTLVSKIKPKKSRNLTKKKFLDHCPLDIFSSQRFPTVIEPCAIFSPK